MRKRIPVATELSVLLNSRRRCCFCFGLLNDYDSKEQGQIAHLDRNPANNNENNLAYMCLTHHASYDSGSRQSKMLSSGEAKKYRDELYEFNKRDLPIPDRNEERDIVFYIKGEARTVTFKAIRRHLFVISCSDTRAAETQRQLNDLVGIGLLVEIGSGEYIVNEKALHRL